MSVKNTVQAILLQRIAFGSISNAFDFINPGGTPKACFMLRIINTTDAIIEISYDDNNEHDVVNAFSSLEVYAQASAQPNTYTCLFPIGFTVSARYRTVAPTEGSISLAGYYQPTT